LMNFKEEILGLSTKSKGKCVSLFQVLIEWYVRALDT